MSARLTKNLPRTDPELEKLLKESAEAVKRMSPAELEEMLRKQRESWARQDMD